MKSEPDIPGMSFSFTLFSLSLDSSYISFFNGYKMKSSQGKMFVHLFLKTLHPRLATVCKELSALISNSYASERNVRH